MDPSMIPRYVCECVGGCVLGVVGCTMGRGGMVWYNRRSLGGYFLCEITWWGWHSLFLLAGVCSGSCVHKIKQT